MPCPTCSHTMEAVASDGGPYVRHCPRCGTMTIGSSDNPIGVYVPKLVERCRKLGETLGPPWGDRLCT